MYHDRRCCTTKLSSSSVSKHHGVANIAGDVAEYYLGGEEVGTAIRRMRGARLPTVFCGHHLSKN